jgi:hypothetical protein
MAATPPVANDTSVRRRRLGSGGRSRLASTRCFYAVISFVDIVRNSTDLQILIFETWVGSERVGSATD